MKKVRDIVSWIMINVPIMILSITCIFPVVWLGYSSLKTATEFNLNSFSLPASLNFGLVKEATQLAKAKGVDEVSPAMLEGFASAKVLVEGLRRAGAKPSRASLHQALDNLGRLDLGGLVLDYSPSDHTGLDFADLSIVGTGGRFRR